MDESPEKNGGYWGRLVPILIRETKPRFNIDAPRWDQSTYEGRCRHFFAITNPLNLLKSDEELKQAKDVVQRFRAGDDLSQLSDDYIWEQKHIYDSAFHPDSGDKIFFLGRMSCQVPYNIAMTSLMMAFYKSKTMTIILHCINQMTNAITNVSNRSGSAPITNTQLGTAFVIATSGGIGTALGLGHALRKARPIIGRFVPFASAVSSNALNLPVMRFSELTQGAPVSTENGKEVGLSRVAGREAIGRVFISRICMCMPSMLLTPVIVNSLDRKGFLKKYPGMNLPVQAACCAVFLSFSTPMACAIWPQRSSLPISKLEAELQERVKKIGVIQAVYYNKGL